MLRRLVPVFMTVALIAAVIGAPVFAGQPGEGRECPLILPESRPFVQKTMASKPEDLFVVLKNGLTLLVHQQPGAEVISAQVFVRAGSILEGKYLKAGLSHYLEHVVAGGSTRSFTEAEAKERIRSMGGSTNAYTSYDRTVYYINTGAEHWKDALDILLSYVSENLIDPKEAAREKAVIQQEMKMGESNANTELWKLFIQTAYQTNPVRNPVIGYEEVFVQQTREALLDYYQQRYQPENMIVVLAGNVSPSEALQFVIQKTKNFQSRAAEPVVLPEEPLQSSPRWEEKEVPITRLVQAKIGFPSVNAYDKDMYALDVLAHLLGEGETCRLYCRLKDQENKVYSIGASHWSPSFVRGQFIVSVSLAPTQWPGALTEIQEEIAGFRSALVSGPDLEKAKKTAVARHIFGKESVSAMASSLASSYMMSGDPYFDEEYNFGIRSVTAEEVRSVAQRYLVPERMSVAVIKPLAPEQKPGQAAAAPACPVPQTTPVEFGRMPNGLKTLVKQDAGLPFVTMHIYGTGGLALEDFDRPGISAFTASLLASGTRTRTKMELAKQVEDAGGIMGATSDNNTYHVSIKVLKEDFDWALDLLADVVRDAQFPAEEIEKQRQDTLVAIKRSDERWQSEVMKLFRKNYFKTASYANDRLGTAESVGAFTREDVLSFYRKMVNPTHSVLAVFGDVDPAKAKARIAEKFAAWSGAPVVKALPEETRQIRKNGLVEIKNEKKSAALFIGTNGLDVNNSERPVLDVISSILSGGGAPAGRIFDALRGGDTNLVYAVHAFPFYGKNAGFFGVLTQTTMGNLDKVQQIVMSNLKRLADEAVPAIELERSKEAMLVGQKLGRETLDAQASSAALNEVLGLGWDYDKGYPERVRAVSAEQVRGLARKLFANTLTARTLPEHPVEILASPPPVKSDVQM
ncbi:MAG: pitrilysin family protein [Syntrophobacteraceae bacterium]